MEEVKGKKRRGERARVRRGKKEEREKTENSGEREGGRKTTKEKRNRSFPKISVPSLVFQNPIELANVFDLILN